MHLNTLQLQHSIKYSRKKDFILFLYFLFTQTLLIIRQRMYTYEHYLDFPLQKNHQRENPLNSYIPQNQQRLFQLPRQLNNSPFMPNNNYHRSKIPTQSNHSISKFAFTETSTQDQKEDEQTVPICQNIYFNQKTDYDQDGFLQEITQATFKPKELKKQLDKIKDSNKHLKKLLTDNLLKKQDKNVNIKSSSTARCHSKTKTKYQKILDEFFCKKDTKQVIKRKISVEKIPNYKLKYREDEDILKQQTNRYLNQLKKSRETLKPQLPNTLRNQPSKNTLQEKPYKQLTKTFSVQQFSRQNDIPNRQISVKSILDKKLIESKDNFNRESIRNKSGEGWLGMNFHQRQARSLQKRKEKENIGKELNLKKQSEGCTFKPATTEFRPKKVQSTASSYAKRYFQKLKRF